MNENSSIILLYDLLHDRPPTIVILVSFHILKLF